MKIYLPRLHGDIPPEPAVERRVAAPGGRREKVLAVEDDDGMRRHSIEMLSEIGYTVLEAANGSQALDVIEADPEIAVLFTDVGLPGGMNGRQLADEACRRRPQLLVLYTTGYVWIGGGI